VAGRDMAAGGWGRRKAACESVIINISDQWPKHDKHMDMYEGEREIETKKGEGGEQKRRTLATLRFFPPSGMASQRLRLCLSWPWTSPLEAMGIWGPRVLDFSFWGHSL
jgi:hypothetical protein